MTNQGTDADPADAGRPDAGRAAAGRPVGIVLAAGAGRRMGGPKAILEFEGVPLVARAVRTAFAGGCGRVIAVLGAGAARAEAAATDAGARIVVNQRWAEGMGTSLHAGLSAAAAAFPEATAALVLLVDQPFITPQAVAAVLAAQRDPRDAAVLASAVYEGRRGHPVLLGGGHWEALLPTLTGDAGARDYLRAHRDELILVPCDTLADPRDLDVPADLPPGTATA
jgi:nicotine blue oxidoreductase